MEIELVSTRERERERPKGKANEENDGKKGWKDFRIFFVRGKILMKRGTLFTH